MQQGDPLGPLLFCLCIHDLGSKLLSELACFYLDDGTLGCGCVEALVHDLDVVKQIGDSIGLSLNAAKSEVLCGNDETAASFESVLPGARRVCVPVMRPY